MKPVTFSGEVVEASAVNGQIVSVVTECKRCGHQWSPRVVQPKTCPRCKSYAWSKEKK